VADGAGNSLLDQILLIDGADILDLRMSQEEAAETGLACYKTDSHWTSWGAYFAYKVIMARLEVLLGISFQVPTVEELRKRQIIFENGDLRPKGQAEYLEGDLFESECHEPQPPESVWHYSPPSVRARQTGIPAHLNLSRTRESHVFENIGLHPVRALVFINSYGMWLAPFLVEHFARTALVWYPSVDRMAILKEKPDVVIQVTVDRFLRLPPEQ
jgi:hypothetical protein